MAPTLKVEIAALLLHALAWMASHNVMHRDIKPDNVLLTDEGAPVLTDFSLAKVVEATTEQPAATKAADKAGKEKAGKKRKHDKGASDKGGAAVHTSAMGTPTYTAPEIVSGGSDYGTQADVWSMGVVFYELFHGEMPPLTLTLNLNLTLTPNQ